MKKYLILAMLPILFQNALYGADLNKVIQQQLISARNSINIKVKLELDPILHALVKYGEKSSAHSVTAINAMRNIKDALLQYKSEQYTSSWLRVSQVFNKHPEKVSKEIDPAITKVNKALQSLQKNASKKGFAVAGALAVAALALGSAIIYNNHKKASANNPIADVNEAVVAQLVEQAFLDSEKAREDANEAARILESFGKGSESYKRYQSSSRQANIAAESAKKCAEEAAKANQRKDYQVVDRDCSFANIYYGFALKCKKELEEAAAQEEAAQRATAVKEGRHPAGFPLLPPVDRSELEGDRYNAAIAIQRQYRQFERERLADRARMEQVD